MIQPDFEGRYLWRRFLLPYSQKFISQLTSDLAFNPVKGRYLFGALFGDEGYIVREASLAFYLSPSRAWIEIGIANI